MSSASDGIDADKPSNPAYLERALKLSKPGTVIVADNVVRDGKVVDGSPSADDNVKGVRSHGLQFLLGTKKKPVHVEIQPVKPGCAPRVLKFTYIRGITQAWLRDFEKGTKARFSAIDSEDNGGDTIAESKLG